MRTWKPPPAGQFRRPTRTPSRKVGREAGSLSYWPADGLNVIGLAALDLYGLIDWHWEVNYGPAGRQVECELKLSRWERRFARELNRKPARQVDRRPQ